MIPAMTDPLGRHWQQPDHAEILLDDKHAVMEMATFSKLAEYSTSIPSSVYPGKMWKCQCRGGEWVLRWFGEVDGRPDLCSKNQREILLCEAPTAQGGE